MSFSGEEMFRKGALLGSFNGPAQDGQLISIEAPTSGPPLVGRYVLLQKDNTGPSGRLGEPENWQLHVAEFLAFGGTTNPLCLRFF